MVTDEKRKARDRLVSASLRLASAERGGLDGRDGTEELGRASDVFDLAARLYVEVIGPREVEPPERLYGDHEVRGADEEE